MSGNSFLLDTNIVLYLLNGDETLADFLYKKNLYVSFITELELLSFHKITNKEQQSIQSFLKECFIIELNSEMKQQVIKIRKQHNTKLPDSIIAASSVYTNIPLVTSDNGFEKIKALNLIKYNT